MKYSGIAVGLVISGIPAISAFSLLTATTTTTPYGNSRSIKPTAHAQSSVWNPSSPLNLFVGGGAGHESRITARSLAGAKTTRWASPADQTGDAAMEGEEVLDEQTIADNMNMKLAVEVAMSG